MARTKTQKSVGSDGYEYSRDTFKMFIELNDDAIYRDNYNVQSYHECVEKIFTGHGLVKDDDGFFYGQGERKDCARFCAAITDFENCQWFKIRHLSTWELYEKDDFSGHDDDYEVSDCISGFVKYNPARAVNMA